MERMKEIMAGLRSNTPTEIGGLKVTRFEDYAASTSIDTETGAKTMLTLPKSDVLTFKLTDGASVIIRPSGTELKLKSYVFAEGQNQEDASEAADAILKELSAWLNMKKEEKTEYE